jgi:hypothetical protein
MSVDMTTQAILVKQGWPRDGSGQYVGSNPNTGDGTSGGTSALAWSAPSGLTAGNTVTITTDGTYDFGTKANAKPLFYWKADDGAQGNLILGRSDWQDPEPESFSTEQVAPNSTRSVKATHDINSGAALGWVHFATRDALIFRRLYEDLDVQSDYAVRTRVSALSGDPSTITEGMTATGATSGAVGTIYFYEDGVVHDALYYLGDPVGGDFVNGETLTISNGVTLTCAETPYRTSNYKTLRIWSDNIENHHYSAVEYRQAYALSHENTDSGTYYPSTVTQDEYTWLSQLFRFRNSSAATVADASFKLKQGNAEANEDGFISFEDDLRPYRIAQTQVSNGMAKGSASYWDTLYIDDTLHCVVIGDAATWGDCVEFEPQPPSAWNGNSITVQLSRGTFSDFSNKYLYVLDNSGEPVTAAGGALL